MLLLPSCNSDTSSKNAGRRAGTTTDSAPYELLLVADKDWLQTSDGSVLLDVVNTEIPGLPAPEPNFKIISINPSAFSKTFQGFANMVIADIGPQYTQGELHTRHDLYAHPQTIIYLTAPNGRELAKLAMDRQDQIISTLLDAELTRERNLLRLRHSDAVFNQAKQQFGYTLLAPASIDAVKVGEDFMWASSDTEDNRLNICLYTIPFAGGEFGAEAFIAVRDSVMKINIEGERQGQYMSTNAATVLFDVTNVDGKTLLVARGLWEMVGDMMGGPFVSYIYFDEPHQKLVFTEGFVYAPEKKKRAYIHELEAAIQTLQLTH